MDAQSCGWLRRRGVVGLAAAIFSASALAGCGAANSHAHAPEAHAPEAHAPERPPLGIAHPVVPGARVPPGAPAAPGVPAAPRVRRRRSHGTWLIDPDEPLPRNSRWWPVLAVARRFAAVDMSYEIGEVGPAVRRTITRTCTATLARELLSHRPSLPPGVSAAQVRQRLVGVTPLERLRHTALVLATVRSAGRGGAAGAFELHLVPRAVGWRVIRLNVV
jgi:hypothetical protein